MFRNSTRQDRSHRKARLLWNAAPTLFFMSLWGCSDAPLPSMDETLVPPIVHSDWDMSPPIPSQDQGVTSAVDLGSQGITRDQGRTNARMPDDSCLTLGLRCQSGCAETGTGPQCVCDPGFALAVNGINCIDIDECARDNGGCPNGCRNLLGDYECLCEPGFAQNSDGHQCVDVDECNSGESGCEDSCVNLVGGFECTCEVPRRLAPDGYSCIEPLDDNSPDPLFDRSADGVCDRWRAHIQRVRPEWQPGDEVDQCHPGETTEAGLQNALLRTNLYRWIAGLEPVELARGQLAAQQACALMQSRSGYLNHRPEPDAPCYSEAGASAAGQSNLARGSLDLASSIGRYIADIGVNSLGHRRWIFNPGMTETAFGVYRGSSCMYVIGRSAAHDKEYVAWPPAGFVPEPAVRGRFSFSNYRLRLVDEFTVHLSVNGGPSEAIDTNELPGQYGRDRGAWSYVVPRAAWAAGNTLTIRIGGFEDGPIEYEVRPIGCQ